MKCVYRNERNEEKDAAGGMKSNCAENGNERREWRCKLDEWWFCKQEMQERKEMLVRMGTGDEANEK